MLSTKDFKEFKDHGLVYLAASNLRGTAVVESPCVVFRDGVWYWFFGVGEGFWHTMSSRPDNFMGQTDLPRGVLTGIYYMGAFHAGRVIQDTDGQGYMISTSKEAKRRLNRVNGISVPRGSKVDESSLLDGVFMAKLDWDGDYPVLKSIE